MKGGAPEFTKEAVSKRRDTMSKESKKKIAQKVEKTEQEKAKAAGLPEQELAKVAGGVGVTQNPSKGNTRNN
jgi:hypothetical protein